MDLLYFASAAWFNQKCPSFISPQLEVLKSWFIEFKQALHALNIAEEFQSIFIDKLGDSISRIPFIATNLDSSFSRQLDPNKADEHMFTSTYWMDPSISKAFDFSSFVSIIAMVSSNSYSNRKSEFVVLV